MPVLFKFPTPVLWIILSVLPCLNLLMNTEAAVLCGSENWWQLFKLNCLPSCLYASINFWYNKEIVQSAARIRGELIIIVFLCLTIWTSLPECHPLGLNNTENGGH